MKKFIFQYEKCKEICRVLNSCPQAYISKNEAKAMIEEFSGATENFGSQISKLLRPSSTIYRPKQYIQQMFIVSIKELIGMGILLATHLDNRSLLDILKVYKNKVVQTSAFKLYEIAMHVLEELQNNAEVAIEFGVTDEMLTAFESQIAEFGATLDTTRALLVNRKLERMDMNTTSSSCSKIIRMKLDPFIIFNEKEFPELYKEYFLVRGGRKRRKIVPKDENLADVSGIVTDSVTSLPIVNATITAVEQEVTAITDENGYYLIDELAEGNCHFTCSAPNYEMPAEYPLTLIAGESVSLDFSLVPVVPQNQV